MTAFFSLFREETISNILDNSSLLIVWLIFIISLIVLSKGAGWIIDSIVSVATKTGIPKGVLGATIVSAGTTLPEVFVSVTSAISGNSAIALGNGIGSIIADTALIFGVMAFLTMVPINKSIFHRLGRWQAFSLILVIGLSFLSYVFNKDGPHLNRISGVILLLVLFIYLGTNLKKKNYSDQDVKDVDYDDDKSIGLLLLIFILGAVCVYFGSKLFVASAVEIAQRLGIPEATIAVTIIAFGTSLPELVTAIVAVRKKEVEIMVGNIMGADILNALFVIGASAVFYPLEISMSFFIFHFPFALLIIIIFRVGFHISKKKFYFNRYIGLLLFLMYLLYNFLLYTN